MSAAAVLAPRGDLVAAVEYVVGDGARRREPLAACWPEAFENVAPVRGFPSYRGQRNWPGAWWFSRTGLHVGYESWVERDALMALVERRSNCSGRRRESCSRRHENCSAWTALRGGGR